MWLTTCLPPGQTGSPYKWVVQGNCLVWVPFDKELYTSHFFLLVSAGRSTYSSPSLSFCLVVLGFLLLLHVTIQKGRDAFV